jgi:acetyl-CoA synthetase
MRADGALSELLSPDDVWKRVIGRLKNDPTSASFNCYDEVCGRWANGRSRLALTICLADGSREQWTYRELEEHSASAAAMLRDLGLQRGDRVASLLSRQVEAWILALAAWRSGVILVPLFVGFGGDAIRDRLAASGATVVVVDHRFRANAEAGLDALGRDLPLVVVGSSKVGGDSGARFDFWQELERPRSAVDTAIVAGWDPATLLFTSGTTSEPKGCIIPHNGYLSLVPFVEHGLAIDDRDLLFATSDPGWSYGLYTCGAAPMSLGIPRVLYAGDFDPEAWLRMMAAEGVTYAAAAPTAVRRLVAAGRTTNMPGSLKGMATGGEPLDTETIEAWTALTGTELRDGYGLTEVGMLLSNLGSPPLGVRPGWLAAEVPGFSVHVADDDGREVAPGEPGVLRVRRPRFQLSVGYENAPEAWSARWHDDCFVTDDLFVRDNEGRFRFIGRRDDIIVTSGYNVGPAEVEAVLLRHRDVREAAAVAHSDTVRGSVVRAVVVPAPDADREQLAEELKLAVSESIGRHASPRLIDFVDELPRTSTGKVRRNELRRRPVTEV